MNNSKRTFSVQVANYLTKDKGDSIGFIIFVSILMTCLSIHFTPNAYMSHFTSLWLGLGVFFWPWATSTAIDSFTNWAYRDLLKQD